MPKIKEILTEEEIKELSNQLAHLSMDNKDTLVKRHAKGLYVALKRVLEEEKNE